MLFFPMNCGNDGFNDTRTDPNRKVKEAVSCLRCSKKLSSKQTLGRHYHDVHGLSSDLIPVELRTFPCPESICKSKPFKRRSQLYAHMRAVHNGKSREQGRRTIHASEVPQSSTQKQELLSSINLVSDLKGGPPGRGYFFDAAADFPNVDGVEYSLDSVKSFEAQEGGGEYGSDLGAFGLW